MHKGKGSIVGLAILAANLGLFALVQAPAHAATATRTSAFEYDPTTGLLTKEIIEPGNSALCLVTTYSHDSLGNVTSSTTRNCSGPSGEEVVPAPTGDAVFQSRTGTNVYSTAAPHYGRFPTTSTNALNQSETKTFSPAFGGITSLTGPNELTTTWTYDSFGRRTLETRADGTKTKWEYILCSGVGSGSASCPTVGSTTAKYYIQETPLAADGVTPNGAWTRTYFDMLNREIRVETRSFSDVSIYADTEYDSIGRVLRTSRPYLAGATAQWTTLSYDVLSRVIEQVNPDHTAGTPSRTTITYNGLSVTTTRYSTADTGTQSRTETRNSQGQLAQVKDTQNNTLSYTYDPFGNLLKTTDVLGNQTTVTYDLRGRKTGMVDRDMGSWTYAYNGLGELIRQTDAKSQVTTLLYDKLGRMTQRNEPDLISNWYYDTRFGGAACAKGIGKLCEARADNGYRRVMTYDSLGRASNVATYIDNPSTPYNIANTYDSNNRVATQTYPSGYAVKYSYNARGYLTEVRRNSNNALLWRVDAMNAEGQITQQTHGNNVVTNHGYDLTSGRLLSTTAGAANGVQNMTYVYDTLGNLKQRQDGNFSQVENFQYDALNRLVGWQIAGSGISGTISKAVTYNAIGNILTKSGVGTYIYNASGATSTRPHAVASITGTVNGVVNPTFAYDANGNLLSGAGRTITYTSYNQVRQIVSGRNIVSFSFDVDHQRVNESTSNDTTIFVMAEGVHYEKKNAGGLTTHQHFIKAYGMSVALYINKSGTLQTRYLHLDHLGSIRAITNESGSVAERLAYDPWGKRRFANGNDDPGNTLISAVTDRGFTEHEHLDEVGLIHMNGRVYDPLLGRFVSADPIIPDEEDLQAFNRFAYVLNNPLRYVDPTGYDFWETIGPPVVVPGTPILPPNTTLPNLTNPPLAPAPVSPIHGAPTFDPFFFASNPLMGSPLPGLPSSHSFNIPGSGGNLWQPVNQLPNSAQPLLGDAAQRLWSGTLALVPGQTQWNYALHNFGQGNIGTGLFNTANSMGEFVLFAATAGGGSAMLSSLRAITHLARRASNAGALDVAAKAVTPGSFNLINWAKYPSWAPKPTGTLRVLSGVEYDIARKAANAANAALRRADPAAYAGKQIHEIIPVKFGGSPTDLVNKTTLTPAQHAELTNFWNQLMRDLP